MVLWVGVKVYHCNKDPDVCQVSEPLGVLFFDHVVAQSECYRGVVWLPSWWAFRPRLRWLCHLQPMASKVPLGFSCQPTQKGKEQRGEGLGSTYLQGTLGDVVPECVLEEEETAFGEQPAASATVMHAHTGTLSKSRKSCVYHKQQQGTISGTRC